MGGIKAINREASVCVMADGELSESFLSGERETRMCDVVMAECTSSSMV